MPQIDTQGTLIVIDFIARAEARAAIEDDGSPASIHHIIPYLIRSLSLQSGFSVIDTLEDTDYTSHPAANLANVPRHCGGTPVALSKVASSSKPKPRLTDQDSRKEKVVSDDEFE